MNLVEQIKKDEGFRRFAYKCPAGKLTIGYGRNIDENGGKGITRQEGWVLLSGDLADCESDLPNVIHAEALQAMGQVRRNVLMGMRYNLGPAGFRSFQRMIAAVNRKQWSIAANEIIDSKAAGQNPARYYRFAEEMRLGVSDVQIRAATEEITGDSG